MEVRIYWELLSNILNVLLQVLCSFFHENLRSMLLQSIAAINSHMYKAKLQKNIASIACICDYTPHPLFHFDCRSFPYFQVSVRFDQAVPPWPSCLQVRNVWITPDVGPNSLCSTRRVTKAATDFPSLELEDQEDRKGDMEQNQVNKEI